MKPQRGVTLIIALIFLLLITLGGISMMQEAKTQQVIVNTFEEKEVSFQAAETALRTVEGIVEATAFTTADFLNGCAGVNCFSNNCANGLCSTVTYLNAANVQHCTTNGTRVWENPAQWANAVTLPAITVTRSTGGDSVVFNPRYLIEFRCYVPNVASPTPATIPLNNLVNSEWSEYYRITVRVDGSDNAAGASLRDAPVVLQSTYRKN